jgi:hypothetical protein
MKAFRLFIIFFVGLSLQSYTQEKQPSNIKYSISIEGAVCGGINHFSIEQTVVNGINTNERHVVGIGMGLGLGTISEQIGTFYCPVYLNYRHYFKTGIYSLHLNFAIGLIIKAGVTF